MILHQPHLFKVQLRLHSLEQGSHKPLPAPIGSGSVDIYQLASTPPRIITTTELKQHARTDDLLGNDDHRAHRPTADTLSAPLALACPSLSPTAGSLVWSY